MGMISIRVAIIGAGLSGLSCAHELKLHGIDPVIFEEKSMIGEILDYQNILFNMFNFPQYGDSLKFLKKKYNLDIKHQFRIREISITAPNRKVYTARGNLGYIMKRGTARDSVENQLIRAADVPVRFNTYVEIENITDEFDHIVVATGTDIIPKKFNIFSTTFNGFVRIANVLGEFKTGSVRMWFNSEYSKNAYAYLIPYSSKAARLILIVNGITHEELDVYWKKFLEEEKITYYITEARDREHNVGFVDPVQVGKVYFVGNAGGFIDDLFGFGSAKAEISGVTAARAIIRSGDYDRMIKPFKDDFRKKHEFRTVMNTWSNDEVSRALAFLHFPIIKQFIYNNPLFKLTHTTFIAKAHNFMWRKNKKQS